MSQPDDFELSTVEDLDPERSTGEGLSRRREFVLGTLLVLAVLVWALWQVWTTESKRESYRRGGEAAGVRNWDEARSHYLAASGYRDADSRAAEAVRNISERDRSYRSALDQAQKGDWVKAMRAVQEVRRIQPDYLQPMPDPLLQAESEVYRDALEGTIALRAEAQPPGLYYRAHDGWRYLEGSDQWSSVLGTGPSSHVVYDVPGESPTPSGAPTPGPIMSREMLGWPGSPGLKGRHLRVASLVGDSPSSIPLAFDPADYNFYVWGKEGVWAFRFVANANENPQKPVLLSTYGELEMAHQRYSSPVTFTMSLPNPDTILMGLSPDGIHMLLTERDEPIEGDPTLTLHIAHGNGSDASPVYTHRGGFTSAQFGSWEGDILLATFVPSRPSNRRSETHTLVLPDVQTMTSPKVLAETFRNVSSDPYFMIQSTFIREGPFAGKVALVEWGRHANTIKIVDPYSLDGVATEVNVPIDAPGRVEWTYEATEDGLLLYAQSGYDSYPRNPAGNTLTIVRISEDGKSTVGTLTVEGRGRVTGLAVEGGYLIYSTQPLSTDKPAARSQYAVYSARLSQLGTGYFGSTLFYNGVRPAGLSPVTATWHFGSGLLAYTRNGELHVRTYRGDTDIILETGVNALYDSSLYESLSHRLR